MKCRHCFAPLGRTLIDLGFAPPSNAYLAASDLVKPEIYYPLSVKVCEKCWLTQTEDYVKANGLFNAEYAYFSSTSKSWMAHSARYATKITNQLRLTKHSLVIEVASNDGYLLRNFLAAGIPCLGIEPTNSTASAAEKLGIPVIREFFSEELARQLAEVGKQADLIAGNNVYAHVPDINDFTKGLKVALKPRGTITLEFPHLMRLLEYSQFDTIYHEHFSYLSLYTVERIFLGAGLRVWDVEELGTHGGSLRIYGCHSGDPRQTSQAVFEMLAEEQLRGLQTIKGYQYLQAKAEGIKDELLAFLIEKKRAGKSVSAFGAAAKGNTLLNYAGVKTDLLPCVFDSATAKQGKFLPGSHIPILPPAILREHSPDYLVILPWNIAEEIKQNFAWLADRGTRFVTLVPRLEIT